MPTYEYACKSCGRHHEVVQSFSDDALTECPACGGPLRKVFGSIGISFKGSGFYRTDSRPAAPHREKEKTDASSGDGGAGKDGAKEAKEAKETTEKVSTGSSSASTSSSSSSSESRSDSSGSTSGGSDKAKAAASPA